MTDLQTLAKQHLMLHFSDMTLDPEDIPVLVRGDGCHIYDDLGNRYIDGLSGLYCTNLGHSHECECLCSDTTCRIGFAEHRIRPNRRQCKRSNGSQGQRCPNHRNLDR